MPNPVIQLEAESIAFPIIEAAEGESQSLRRFSMVAYRGGPLKLPNYKFPLVVRLSGIQIGDQVRPALIDHKKDAEHVLGQTDRIILANGELLAEGDVMGESPTAQNVIGLNDKGYRWQCSIGALPIEAPTLIPAGKAFTENGRNFVGPMFVSTLTDLGEISFVVKGADRTSAARIAASAAEDIMTFEEFVAGKGFDAATLSDVQKTFFNTLYQQSQQQQPPPVDAANNPPPQDDPNKPKPGQQPPPADATAGDFTITAADQLELNRINAIASVCHGAYGEHPAIEAQAIEGGWDMRRTRLEVVRARRPQAPAIHVRNHDRDPQIIEASLCMAAGIDANACHERGWFSEQVIEAAESAQWRNMSIGRFGHEIVAAAGGYIKPGRIDTEGVYQIFTCDRKLNDPMRIEASGSGGMSTMSLTGVLGSMNQKILLNSFLAIETIIEEIAVIQSAPDYKQFKAFQVTMSGDLEEIGPDGELPDVTMREEDWANQVKLKGAYISLSEVTFVNDDLGVFTMIPKMFGRKSAINREKAGFKVLLGGANSFYSTANENYMEGSDTALSIASLTAATLKLGEKTDADGDPIMVPFNRILVPPALSVTADQLYKRDTIVVAGNTDVQVTDGNPHVGSFKPMVSPFCGTKFGLTGSSNTAWSLLPEKGDMAPLQLAYLNGQSTPTVEKGDVDFRKLGVAWRVTYRFGFAQGQKRAIFRSKGAA